MTMVMQNNGGRKLPTYSNNFSKKKKTKPLSKLDTKLADMQEVIYSVAQLAEELGTTPAAIRKRIARGFIPAHREGRRLFILKSEYVGCLRGVSEIS